jgi:hypothetical protein
MTEKLLQFIWNLGYFNNKNLQTTDGENLAILSRGIINYNQGPDFSNAKIVLGTTTFAGTIELHLKTSDWRKHQHESDGQYKNVILHVVYHHDEKVNDIPVLELDSRISNLLLEQYTSFMDNASPVPCGSNLQSVNALVLSSWKERLLVERLLRRSNRVMELLNLSNNHWEETFWWLLARNFGSKINGDAFESIARSIPINLLAKHKVSIHQLEALVFGQANLLNDVFEDAYPLMLQREYHFLKKKYALQPSLHPVLFLRMRPGNFPTIRLAQLAMLIHQTSHLFSKILETESIAELKKLFSVTANDFWHYHYTFKQPSAFKQKVLGTESVRNIIINTVAPVLFAYGIFHKNEKLKTRALQWLEELPAEANAITSLFSKAGLANGSAYDSQALIELKTSYCLEKRCLECGIGNYLLKEAAHGYNLLNPSSEAQGMLKFFGAS